MKRRNFSPFVPRYWFYWSLFSLLWLLSHLPMRCLIRIGEFLGFLVRKLAKRAYRNTEINLKLCYPELSELQRQRLIKANFRSVGIGIMELLLSWWASDKRLARLANMQDTHHIDAALAAGKGVIVAAPHLTSLELALRMFSTRYPVAVMYNRQKHPWLEYLNQRALKKYYSKAIARENVRAMVKALKHNMIICYTPDIDPGGKNGLFVPFFNIPAATVTGPTRFAQMTGAKVLFAVFYRRDDGQGYDLTVQPIADFPSEDDTRDARVINGLLESAIRHKPEQYIWQYKRFKTRPKGEASFYD